MLVDQGLLTPKFQPFSSYNDYPVNNKKEYNATLVRDVYYQNQIYLLYSCIPRIEKPNLTDIQYMYSILTNWSEISCLCKRSYLYIFIIYSQLNSLYFIFLINLRPHYSSDV